MTNFPEYEKTSILKDAEVYYSNTSPLLVLADIGRELVFIRDKVEPQEVVMLNSKPILQFWPVEHYFENRDGAIVVTASVALKACQPRETA